VKQVKNNPTKRTSPGIGQSLVFMTLAASLALFLAGSTTRGSSLVAALVFMTLATSLSVLFARASAWIAFC